MVLVVLSCPACFVIMNFRFVIACIMGVPFAVAEVASAAAGAVGLRGEETFQSKVMPVLQTYCYDCHGDGMDKGNFVLDKHNGYAETLADRKLWDHVREIMSTHVMPPENKDQPTREERQTVLSWIEEDVFWVDPERPDPGHVTLRRLNRTEYNNTVQDVFGIKSRPANSFPPDDTGYGYDNIGDVLTLSPLLMEKYMRAAREVAEEAVWYREPERHEEELSGDEFKVVEGNGAERYGMMALFSRGEIEGRAKVMADGLYRMTMVLSSNKAGNENARYQVLVDGQEVKKGEVSAEFDGNKIEESVERVSFDVWMKKGERKMAVRFLNDHYDEAAAEPKRRDRNLLLRVAYVEGPIKFRPVKQAPLVEWLFQGRSIVAPQMVLTGNDFDKLSPGGVQVVSNQVIFYSNGTAGRLFETPVAGEYRVTLVASANQAGQEPARLEALLGGEKLPVLELTQPDGKEQRFSFTRKLDAGEHQLAVSFLNDLYVDGKDRNAFLERVVIEGPLTSDIAEIFGDEQVKKWVSRLGLKVFRRPVEEEDMEKLVALVRLARESGAEKQEALSVVVEAMMSSSKFLFNGAPRPVGEVRNGSALVDEFTLASRLSYFLWSSAPDDRLLELAGKGQLRANLRAEVTRMIGDEKGWALTENFAGQWLRLRDVDLVSPDRRRFSEFYEGSLRNDMRKESMLFFDHILRGNRSALEILDSDYTFVNETLAKHYKIEGVKGRKFQKVSLEGTPRGGILTQGSVLTLTSHPTRTSPVKRGQFLLENVLGTPPPPAPQNVPEFGEDRGAKVEGTLRQRFEAHRSNPACASCHAFLDPFGFAFENYDAIGRWREEDNKQAIDATGKLLTGETFDGAKELRKLLVELKKDDFTRNLVENLLIYSLGRGLDYPDKLFVKQLKQRAERDGHRFQDLLVGVVESIPFQRMRVQAATAKETAQN